jgi:hypothetical protein
MTGGESGIRTQGTEGRILGPSNGYLLRNDWLSCSIGALLCLLGRAKAPQGIAPCRVIYPGGAEVVRRMASREPQRIL